VGTLLDDGPGCGPSPVFNPGSGEEVVSLEAGGLAASLRLSPRGAEAEATAHELCVQDLCSHGRGVAKPLLQRWTASAPRATYGTANRGCQQQT